MTHTLKYRPRLRWLMGVLMVACLLASIGGAAASEAQAAPPSDSKLMWLRIYDSVNDTIQDKKTSDDQICDAIGFGVLTYLATDYRSWWVGTADGKKAQKALRRASGKYRLCNWFTDSGRNGLTKAYPSILITQARANDYIRSVRLRVLKDTLNDIYNAAKCGTSVSLMSKLLLPFKLGKISKWTFDQAMKKAVC